MNWKNAYEERLTLWEYAASPRGKAALSEWASYHVAPTLRETYSHLVHVEEHKLSTADPIFVAAEMCDLITMARESFQPEVWQQEDLMTPTGFVYYEQPMPILDRHGKLVEIRGFSYCPMVAPPEALAHGRDITPAVHGVALTLYSESGNEWVDREVAQTPISMAPLHMQPVWFGMDFGEENIDVDDGTETGASEWWTLVQVTLRMMQQHVAATYRLRPDRPMRRRAERKGIPEQDVVIVRLRRPDRPPKEGESEEAHYSHRFIRVGHWRMQWYPSLKLHRQIWIDQVIIGPDDKPLIVKGRVYNWDR